MKHYYFTIAMVVCCLFSTCIGNKQQQLKLIKNGVPNYYVEKNNDNLVIYSEKDTLVDLVQKDGEYLSKKDGLVVLATKNYNGYYSSKVDEFTSIAGNKKKGFISNFRVNNVYVKIQYDSSYNIRCISKYEKIAYGKEFHDDIDKDISLVDTSYLNKQMECVMW